MRYSDGFRQPAAAEALVRMLHERMAVARSRRGAIAVMEVCGTHTMAVGRHGLRRRLPEGLRLISGPGCPVCVTDAGYIQTAIELAESGLGIATFGDLLQVPTAGGDSLAACRARGGRVQVCYSPLDALRAAAAEPGRKWVLLAIGFETTIAPVLATLQRAHDAGLGGLSALVAFKRVLPAMEAVLADGRVAIDGFLCPPHVSTVIGAAAYRAIAERHGRPCVVAGFEPLDILAALVALVELVAEGRAEVRNEYARVVKEEGNPRAQRLIEEWLEPCAARWRGLGELANSGYRLREDRAWYDAERRYGVTVRTGRDAPGCRCGDVIAGRMDPPQCPLFRRMCTPDSPVGPCMVSSEGSCAAWFKYERAEAAAPG